VSKISPDPHTPVHHFPQKLLAQEKGQITNIKREVKFMVRVLHSHPLTTFTHAGLASLPFRPPVPTTKAKAALQYNNSGHDPNSLPRHPRCLAKLE
jgi:hypothetical protein